MILVLTPIRNWDLAAFVLALRLWVCAQCGIFCACVVLVGAKINTAGLQGKGCRAQEGQQAERWLILRQRCGK